MKYAVVRILGKQFKVGEGEEVLVPRVGDEKLEPEVLLVVEDDKISVGKPVLKEAKLKLKVLKEEEKGEKIDIVRFKAKSRYHKHTGFRPQFTRLLIEKISA